MIISPDSHLYVGSDYIWTTERAAEAWALADRELQEACTSGGYKKVVLLVGVPGSGKSTWLSRHEDPKVVYFDACFSSRFLRQTYLERIRGWGLDPEIIWVRTNLQVCLLRNSRRPPNRKVPLEVIHRMWERLEFSPPAPDECTVKIVGSGK